MPRVVEGAWRVTGIAMATTGVVLEFDVAGIPAPKGSARAMLIGGRARLIASGSNANGKAMRLWATAVRTAALAAAKGTRIANLPVGVGITFRLARPKGHIGANGLPKRGAPVLPTVKPDLDKLARCTLDALVTTTTRGEILIGVLDDDSRIVSLGIMKRYAEDDEQPGAYISISVLDDLREVVA